MRHYRGGSRATLPAQSSILSPRPLKGMVAALEESAATKEQEDKGRRSMHCGTRYHRLTEPSRSVERVGRMDALASASRDFGTNSTCVRFVISVAGRPLFVVAHPAVPASAVPPRTPFTDNNGTGEKM